MAWRLNAVLFLTARWHHDVVEKRNEAAATTKGDLRLWGKPMQITMQIWILMQILCLLRMKRSYIKNRSNALQKACPTICLTLLKHYLKHQNSWRLDVPLLIAKCPIHFVLVLNSLSTVLSFTTQTNFILWRVLQCSCAISFFTIKFTFLDIIQSNDWKSDSSEQIHFGEAVCRSVFDVWPSTFSLVSLYILHNICKLVFAWFHWSVQAWHSYSLFRNNIWKTKSI